MYLNPKSTTRMRAVWASNSLKACNLGRKRDTRLFKSQRSRYKASLSKIKLTSHNLLCVWMILKEWPQSRIEELIKTIMISTDLLIRLDLPWHHLNLDTILHNRQGITLRSQMSHFQTEVQCNKSRIGCRSNLHTQWCLIQLEACRQSRLRIDFKCSR